MNSRIDHFMYAVPSLDAGIQWAADTFGVEPAYGGEHIGLGTRNALLSLGSTYLEIIAPDPAQALTPGGMAEKFSQLTAGGLVTWAAEGNLPEIAEKFSNLNINCNGPNRTQRQTAEGELLVWDLLFPYGTEHGARMPFFIDWLACTNPRETTPMGGDFRSLSITTPDAEHLRSTMAAIDLDVEVSSGEPSLAVAVETGRGEVLLLSTPETSTITMR